MRNRFEKELDQLNLDLIRMGAMAEDAISKAFIALKQQDPDLADVIISADEMVDDLERNIESRCMRLILQQQPVAKDLRMISTILKMITDIERICDQAADIASLAKGFCGKAFIKEPKHILQMASITSDMVKKSIDAYVKQDIELAQSVIAMDDLIDELFDTVRDELIELAIQNKEEFDQIVDFLMIAKYYERIGDHAENIGEWVIFSVTGVHKEQRIL